MEVITTHKNVDFDALASVFAASKLNKGQTLIIDFSLTT